MRTWWSRKRWCTARTRTAASSISDHAGSARDGLCSRGRGTRGPRCERRAGPVDHIVLEQARVGETGRTQRWDSFRLNTPGWINQMLGGQLPSTLDDHFLGGVLAPSSVRRS